MGNDCQRQVHGLIFYNSSSNAFRAAVKFFCLMFVLEFQVGEWLCFWGIYAILLPSKKELSRRTENKLKSCDTYLICEII